MTLSEIKNTYLIYCLHSAVPVPVDVTPKKTQKKQIITDKLDDSLCLIVSLRGREQRLDRQELDGGQVSAHFHLFIRLPLPLLSRLPLFFHNQHRTYCMYMFACYLRATQWGAALWWKKWKKDEGVERRESWIKLSHNKQLNKHPLGTRFSNLLGLPDVHRTQTLISIYCDDVAFLFPKSAHPHRSWSPPAEGSKVMSELHRPICP